MEERNSEFSYHVPHQPARRDYACTRVQHGNNSRDLLILRRRGKRDDRLAALGIGSSAQEIHLSADSAVELVADRIRANLSGEIDLQRRVNCHHVVVSPDANRMVRVGRRMKLENRIVVHKLKQFFCAKRKAYDDLAGVEILT